MHWPGAARARGSARTEQLRCLHALLCSSTPRTRRPPSTATNAADDEQARAARVCGMQPRCPATQQQHSCWPDACTAMEPSQRAVTAHDAGRPRPCRRPVHCSFTTSSGPCTAHPPDPVQRSHGDNAPAACWHPLLRQHARPAAQQQALSAPGPRVQRGFQLARGARVFQGCRWQRGSNSGHCLPQIRAVLHRRPQG